MQLNETMMHFISSDTCQNVETFFAVTRRQLPSPSSGSYIDTAPIPIRKIMSRQELLVVAPHEAVNLVNEGGRRRSGIKREARSSRAQSWV